MIGGLLAEIEQPPANLSTTLIVRKRAAPKSGGACGYCLSFAFQADFDCRGAFRTCGHWNFFAEN